MASRIILARMSRSAGGAVNRLTSALSGDRLLSYSPIKVPINHMSSHRVLSNGLFQKLGFSSSTSPEPNNQTQENENANKEKSEKDQTKPEEAHDSDEEIDLSKEELIKLVSEKDELLEEANKAVEKMKDMVLRSYAESENVISRTKRDAENSKKFAIQGFAKSLLDVADNLERASSVVKESFNKIDATKETADKALPLLKTLLEGVEMTDKQLNDVFRKFGVEKFDASNEIFDPHRHNAVFEVPDPSKPAGTVAIVLKNGYMLHDRVLRPAEVGVTKSPEENKE